MAVDADAGEPRHRIHVHRRANTRLRQLRVECDVESLERCLEAVSRERQPKKHRTVEGVEGDDELMRVRVGDLRALIALAEPYLLVLAVGKRPGFYDRKLAVAQARLQDWDGKPVRPDGGGGCPNCGAPLRREGRCETCVGCGRSTCNGGVR